MPTLSVDINVDQVTCQKAGCSSNESPANLIVTNAYKGADGYMIANGTRLPEGWVRMVQMDDAGRENPFKIYCPDCAGNL